jgi:Acetyltransferase (GNAT) domain
MRSGDSGPAVTSPVPREVWESVLRADLNAVVAQSLSWRDALFASGLYRDLSLLYEFPSGRQVVLPMARHRGAPSWAALAASWPRGWEAAGPICPGGRVSPEEAAAVLTDVACRGPLATEIRLRHDADTTWLSEARQFQVDKACTYVLDLQGGFDRVWQHRFRSEARTAVRKAERSGLDVEVDRSGRLLGVFSELYEKSIRRWSAKQQHEPLWLTRRRMTWVSPTSPARLALMAENFGEDCATWIARSKGQPVAAIIVLRSGAYAKYWRGAMDSEGANPVRANEFLHRLAIEEACREGYRFYDMGSAPGSSLARFKEKLGAAPVLTHILRAERLPVHAARQRSEELVKKMVGFKAT